MLPEARSKVIGCRTGSEGHNALFQDIADSLFFTPYAQLILLIVLQLVFFSCKKPLLLL
jgi:hypothetical protein